MATEATTNFDIKARELDAAERFARNIRAWNTITGASRVVTKAPGTIIKVKHAVATLDNTDVKPGQVIPFSEVTVTETPYEEIKIEKKRKNVKIEDINEYGYDVAVRMTDDAMITAIQQEIFAKFYTYLQTGTLEGKRKTFQSAVAIAQGYVRNKWEKMSRDYSRLIGFVNTLDFCDWLGAQQITTQSEFGYNYLKNYMGFDTLIMSSEIARGKVVCTPADNLITYKLDVSSSDYSRAGLDFTTDRTGLIGLKTVGDFSTAESNLTAVYGVTEFAEYQDGIAVVTVDASSNESDPDEFLSA